MVNPKSIFIFLFPFLLPVGFVIIGAHHLHVEPWRQNQNNFYSRPIICQPSELPAFLCASAIFGGETLRTVKNDAFKRGEMLKYRMHYGFINAGEIVLNVLDENKNIGERNTFHVVGIGYTNSSFDWFFMVRDRYESYIDEEAVIPWLFIRRVNEGGYKINQNQIYNNYKNIVNSDGKNFDVPDNVQDMFSAFYYARTMDFSNAKEGDIFEFPCFVDNEVWPLKMKYVGKETIKSDIGKIRCIKFHPVVQTGRIFKREEDMNAWISDDKNRIPIRAEAKILVGSVKMDLTDYSGIANPLALVEKK